MHSLGLRLSLLFLLHSFHSRAAGEVEGQGLNLNLTSRFDNRLFHLIRQTTSALAQKPEADRNLTKILSSLNLKNSVTGDACDRRAWVTYIKPIYEALFNSNFAIQKNRNDNFAIAILRDPSVMRKVCMSVSEVLECHENGRCDCLTILPKDLKDSAVCHFQGGAGDEGEGEGENEASGGLVGFFKNLFGASSGSRSRVDAAAAGISIASIVVYFSLF